MDDETAVVHLTKAELAILANALNETREALEDWEFPIRVGANPSEAEDLRRRLKTILHSMR